MRTGSVVFLISVVASLNIYQKRKSSVFIIFPFCSPQVFCSLKRLSSKGRPFPDDSQRSGPELRVETLKVGIKLVRKT